MKFRIPRPLQVVMDDVGWFNGKDDREIGGPSRTGIDRCHCLADYTAIEQLGQMLGQRINCAFVLGEWDLENKLPKTIPHFSHFGPSWDNAKYRNPREMAEIAEFISSAEHIDVAIHGLYHGYYMPGTDNHDMSDYYYRIDKALYMVPEDEVRLRLETFLELMHRHGIRKTVNSFVPPSFAYRTFELSRILREYGILYVTTPFATMTPKAPDDTVFVENGIITSNRYNQRALEWDDLAPDFDRAVTPPGILGIHWPNILSMDPAKNAETVDRTKGFFNRSAEQFGMVLSSGVDFCSTQYLYEKYTKVTVCGNTVKLDFSAVPAAPGRLDSFILSAEGRIASAVGCGYAFRDTKKAFSNWQITPQGDCAELLFEENPKKSEKNT